MGRKRQKAINPAKAAAHGAWAHRRRMVDQVFTLGTERLVQLVVHHLPRQKTRVRFNRHQGILQRIDGLGELGGGWRRQGQGSQQHTGLLAGNCNRWDAG